MQRTLVATARPDVRPAGPQDEHLIREFVCGLSAQSQYFRFFTATSPPSSSLLRALTGERTSGPADILVVTDARGDVIGHGMAVDASQDGVLCSDVGLVIADDWQGQGLGTMLLDRLASRAAARDVVALVFDVLPANARMLGIIERHWPGAIRTRSEDSFVITVPVAARRRVPHGGRHDRSAA
jgi:GNAT superfamily N-acetyltransferase